MLDLPSFKNLKVLVVGDVMLDRYWFGSTSRISPEAPVPIVKMQQAQNKPGGAANVAMNLIALGAQVSLLGIIGQDAEGEILIQALEKAHIQHHLVKQPNAPTTTKLRILSHNQQLIRVDFEDTNLNADTEVATQFEKLVRDSDLIILSDYAKGVLNQVEKFILMARQVNKPVLVDPKGTHFTRYRGATLITPNRKEFETVFGVCTSEERLIARATQALQEYAWPAILITRGDEGMTLVQQNHLPVHFKALAKEVYDVSGAGDTVISTLACGIAAGLSLEIATDIANKAASIVVGRLGTATVHYDELKHLVYKTHSQDKCFYDENLLMQYANQARLKGERIVVTNGCFDLLHAGHVDYLNQAKNLGDRLILLINEDDSIKRLKGNTRPINSLAARMQVLAGLEAIDWILPFKEDTPARLIELIAPDVLVKGDDYKVEEIAGADLVLAKGGQVVTIPLLPEFSTTRLIQKIREENLI